MDIEQCASVPIATQARIRYRHSDRDRRYRRASRTGGRVAAMVGLSKRTMANIRQNIAIVFGLKAVLLVDQLAPCHSRRHRLNRPGDDNALRLLAVPRT